MCSAYKLNKQDDYKQTCRTPFSILNQSVVLYSVLTAASWPTFRRQVRWSGIPITLRSGIPITKVCYDPQSNGHDWVTNTHIVKDFSMVSETEAIFFYNPLAFSMIQQMLALWSLVPLPILSLALTSGSSWFTCCWSLAWRIFFFFNF